MARRAGRVVWGTGRVREALQKGEVRLVVVAADASSTQLDKVLRPAERTGVPVRAFGTRASLGRALGVGPISAAGVTEAELADAVLSRLPEAGATAE